MSEQPLQLPLAMWRSVYEHELLHASDRCMIACSGGPDSVALAHLIADPHFRIRDAIDFAPANLALVHVNHHAHDRADEMAAHVAALADQLGIAHLARDVDVRAAMQPGDSFEHVARQLRYAAIAEAAREWGATAVLLAHNRDDQEETTLMGLLEGRGLMHLEMPRTRSLEGTTEGTTARVVRPLLDVPRADIEALLVRHSLRAIDDPTNTDLERTRNRLRHRVLPMIEAAGFSAARRHLRTLADDAREWAAALDVLATAVAARALSAETAESEPPRIDTREIEALPRAERIAAWSALLARLGRGPRDVSRALLTAVDDALDLDHGRAIDIGNGLRLVRDAEAFRIASADDAPVTVASTSAPRLADQLSLEVPVPGCTRFVAGGYAYELHAAVEFVDGSILDDVRRGHDRLHALLQPADTDGLRLRARRPGDRFQPLGAPGSRPLKRVLQSRQVAAAWRRECPLVVDARGRILWAVGVEIADAARVVDVGQPVLHLRVREAT